MHVNFMGINYDKYARVQSSLKTNEQCYVSNTELVLIAVLVLSGDNNFKRANHFVTVNQILKAGFH